MLHAISRNEDFSTLIEIEPFYNQSVKKQEAYKNLPRCQEMMTIQQEIYYIICIIVIL